MKKIVQGRSIVIFSDRTLLFCSGNSLNHPQLTFLEKDHKNFSIVKKKKAYTKTKSDYLKNLRNKYS